ncbi:S9 family peptidase [Halomonas maura]|uniref:S9 family peptidase n=1 Tax=Halomonas maura TaxID=117606 RepID=UPI0025B55526|nr:prolyl oligopeptidase family serine peptidase [Halomonas maura]MDN3557777.1 prolyl oligopeptidase family serine peptidase [Halomonas maura]
MSAADALHAAARPADGFGELRLGPAGVTWLARDADSGRWALWGWREAHGRARRLTPPSLDIASRVNGYGGGAQVPLGPWVVLVAATDQALLALEVGSGRLVPWWSRPGCAYGGLVADPGRQRVLAVEEQGEGRQGGQRLVALAPGRRRVLAEGADFYGAPALSPDGRRLAWVEWSLPHMPWQRARLCIAAFTPDGGVGTIRYWDPGAAVTQPTFAADGRLVCLSDHAGWWQPWSVDGAAARPLATAAADHASTPWQLGECQHLWHADGGVVMRLEAGAARLARVDAAGRQRAALLPDATRVIGVAGDARWVYALTQGPGHGARLARVRHDGGGMRVLATSGPRVEAPLAAEALAAPVGEDKAAQGEAVPAFVYGAGGGPRPLILRVHGGPTAACYPVHDPLIAWWVAQGYAVADINPRGSGSYGRAFRERLAGGWGRLDVADVEALADALVARGIADPARLCIRGQSAGGFTVLNALASSSRFAAGASLYGVTDAVRLAGQTHRFESGYLDWLIGDEAARRAVSPLQRAAVLHGAVLFAQGCRDRVVVPDQTLRMAAALRRAGRTAEVMLFAGEGHGIRHPAQRRRMIARELAFFARATPAPHHDDSRRETALALA